MTTVTTTTVSGQRQQQDAEADVAALLGRLDLAGARAGRGTLAQLRAALALERGLLLERDLELVEALFHAQLRHHGDGISPR